MMTRRVCLPALFTLAGCAFVCANDILKKLPGDSWYQAPGTKMRAVCASPDTFPSAQGSGDCAMVVNGWSGGAYDAGRKRMWIWGGGHGDYHGNELYAFDVEAFKWSRVTDPTAVADSDLSQDPLPGGAPISRHTYDGLAFIDHADRLFAIGGSVAGNGFGTGVTWTFDPKAKQWSDRNPDSADARPQSTCCNLTGEYDPVSRKVFMRDPNWICIYDYDANRWSHGLAWPHSWSAARSVIDPKRRLYFTVGAGAFLAYDIEGNKDVTSDWATTGGDSLLAALGIGAAYDSSADKIFAWKGGGPYALDLKSKGWTRASGLGAPAAPAENGTFGRFRYDADDDVFVLVNSVDQDVWFYKPASDKPVSLRSKRARPSAPVRPRTRAVDGRLRVPANSLKAF